MININLLFLKLKDILYTFCYLKAATQEIELIPSWPLPRLTCSLDLAMTGTFEFKTSCHGKVSHSEDVPE